MTLYNDNVRIRIEDGIEANFGDVKTWAFSTALRHPVTSHEESGAILSVRKKSDGGDYADSGARYDWQTFNHFADMSEARYGLCLSNRDCSFFSLGGSSPDSLCEDASQLRALAGGQIDTGLGIIGQDGENAFFYSFGLMTHRRRFNKADAMRFALEDQNPLVTGFVEGSREVYPGLGYSLLGIDDPDVLLWAFKPAEEGIGSGLIARYWNLRDRPVHALLSGDLSIRSACRATHLEIDQAAVPIESDRVPIDMGSQQMNTYRLIVK